MGRQLLVIAAVLSLVVPAALAAPPADQGKQKDKSVKSQSATSQAAQSAADDKNASKVCKAERAALGVEAFKLKYGTNANKANAHGKCVSGKSKAKTDKAKKEKDETEDAAETEAEKAAAKKCKAERASGAEAFKNKYGTNKNKANAFGKCVSKLAKAETTS